MSVEIIEYIPMPIFERTSFPFKFDCVTNDVPAEPLPISSAKVYVTLKDVKDGDGNPIYINNRDGTNSTNLSINGNNILFDLMPADNVLVLDSVSNYSETHSILFEIFYNSDTDVFKIEFLIKIKRDPTS